VPHIYPFLDHCIPVLLLRLMPSSIRELFVGVIIEVLLEGYWIRLDPFTIERELSLGDCEVQFFLFWVLGVLGLGFP